MKKAPIHSDSGQGSEASLVGVLCISSEPPFKEASGLLDADGGAVEEELTPDILRG